MAGPRRAAAEGAYALTDAGSLLDAALAGGAKVDSTVEPRDRGLVGSFDERPEGARGEPSAFVRPVGEDEGTEQVRQDLRGNGARALG
jgi:hypothetical protein